MSRQKTGKSSDFNVNIRTLLLPPNVRDFVPKDHVSRFIVGLVRESLDLKAITCSYVSGLGQPPFDPRMMVSLLLHGYASGLYSSRRIARACCERNDFVMIVALDPPDFRTISDFRKRHLKALGELFLQVLKLCETAGLVKLGHVAPQWSRLRPRPPQRCAKPQSGFHARAIRPARATLRDCQRALAALAHSGLPRRARRRYSNGHDDPLNFDPESFAESIEAVVKKLQPPDEMRAANRQ